MQKGGSSIAKIQQAYSTVNTNITEVLLASSFEIIFEQLERYTDLIQNMDPIDWQVFVDKRNEMRRNNSNIDHEDDSPFQDEKTEEEIKKEEEEEQKLIQEREEELKKQSEDDESSNFDAQKFNDIVSRRKDKEIKKIKSIYDDKVILKLLRLLEVFTAIALKNSEIHRFVMQVTRPSQILSLINLLLNCRPRQGMITLKIFSNLVKIGIASKTLDDAVNDVGKNPLGQELMSLETTVKFENSPFLQFFFNALLSIRSSQWDKRRLESYGAYNISSGIVRLFRVILRYDFQPDWKQQIEETLDEFLTKTDSYPIEEFDVLISLFEGGEYNGMNIGAYGKTQDGNKFTTVGFVQQWYDLSTPDGQGTDNNFEIREVGRELKSKDDYLLAIYYDEKHPERNDMFLAIPDEVTLISNLTGHSHDYLLDKKRLNAFLKAMEIDKMPDKEDSVSLTKRCVGMKILVEHIEKYGEKIAELFEEDFRNKFINFLLKECSKPSDKKDSMK
jgi:hypothetical protein